MSSIDTMIAKDLAALRDDSRRDLADAALRTTDMYRDGRAGTEARRDALAEERRRELVMMPLTLSHVFAHRVGRIAAGATGLACSLMLVALMTDRGLLRDAAWLLPGLNVGIVGLLCAVAILCAYVIATWFAEAWFARKMRDSIRTSDDPHRDLDDLARGPIELAERAVARVDVLALEFFLAGITTFALTFGFACVIVMAVHDLQFEWSLNGAIQTAILRKNVYVLLEVLAGAVAVAFVVGRAARSSRASWVLRMLASRWMLSAVLLVGAAVLYVGRSTLVTLHMRHELPGKDVRFLLAGAAAFAITGITTWALLWWREREQARYRPS